MKFNNQKLYEKYHNCSGIQKKFLPENNFTHYYSFKTIKKYLFGKEALEIGCGAGSNSFFIANHGLKVTAIDISKNAIDKCIQSSIHLNTAHLTDFVHADFLKFKTNKKFDLIICYEVIEHLDNDIYAVKKIGSLLKKGGIALISIPSENSFLFKTGYSKKFEEKVGHKRRYNEKSLITLCNKTNLKIIEIIKKEGIIRDILFLIKPFNSLIRFIKFVLSDIINAIDSKTVLIFGESRIIAVLQK